MDYKPLKNVMNYLSEKYNSITEKVGSLLFPNITYSRLELAVVGVPSSALSENNQIYNRGYGTIQYFSRKGKVFDGDKGVYAGTKKRLHGDIGNNKGIGWDNVENLETRARLILEAISLKKSDPRYRRTRQPSSKDVAWAREYLKNHK